MVDFIFGLNVYLVYFLWDGMSMWLTIIFRIECLTDLMSLDLMSIRLTVFLVLNVYLIKCL